MKDLLVILRVINILLFPAAFVAMFFSPSSPSWIAIALLSIGIMVAFWHEAILSTLFENANESFVRVNNLSNDL